MTGHQPIDQGLRCVDRRGQYDIRAACLRYDGWSERASETSSKLGELVTRLLNHANTLTLGGGFVFGVVLQAMQFPMAFVLFLAISQLHRANALPLDIMLYLLYYCALGFSFSYVFVGLRLGFAQQSRRLLHAINRGLPIWMPRVGAWLLILLGAFFAVDALSYFQGDI